MVYCNEGELDDVPVSVHLATRSLPIGIVMTHRHLLIVAAFRAGEVAGTANRVGGNYGGLVVVIYVAALFTPLAVGNHRSPFSYYYPSRNLYRHNFLSMYVVTIIAVVIAVEPPLLRLF